MTHIKRHSHALDRQYVDQISYRIAENRRILYGFVLYNLRNFYNFGKEIIESLIMHRIRKETDDLIILTEYPKEFKILVLFDLIIILVFILLSQLSGGYIFFSLYVFIFIGGILINSYRLYRNESIIVDKKGSNIVINKFHGSHKIPFSNIKEIKMERQSNPEPPDIWNVSISIKYTPDVPWWFEGSLYIYGSFDKSEAERFAEKISKITNIKLSGTL